MAIRFLDRRRATILGWSLTHADNTFTYEDPKTVRLAAFMKANLTSPFTIQQLRLWIDPRRMFAYQSRTRMFYDFCLIAADKFLKSLKADEREELKRELDADKDFGKQPDEKLEVRVASWIVLQRTKTYSTIKRD